MLASELLGRSVVDASGTVVGVVHDVRVRLPPSPDLPGEHRPTVAALVVGPEDVRCRLAHAWGYAQDRDRGPAVFRALLGGQASRTRRVEIGEIASWDEHGRIALRGGTP